MSAEPRDDASEDQRTIRERVIRLAFQGDVDRFEEFVCELAEATPDGVDVILRGSAVTGHKWMSDVPFDADGRGTSDLDITFVGGDMVTLFREFHIPGIHSAPLGDAHPFASTSLGPLHRRLCALAGRMVTLQATTSIVQHLRDAVMNPAVPRSGTQAESRRSGRLSVRLLTYNIRAGGVGRAEALAEVISAANPDVVALQEATNPTVVERVAKLAGFFYSGSRPSHSTGFLSRVPLENYAWRHPPRTRHALLEVSLGDGLPRIFVLHLRAWFSKWTEQRRARELRGLLDGIREQLVREQHAFAFHVLAGDFNALAPGEHFDPSPMPAWIRGMIWLSGREMARSTIEMMGADGYVDAWRTIHPDSEQKPGFTFPVWRPHVRLDYVFTPAAYAGRIMGCEVRRTPDASRIASDHFPLLVELG